MHILSDNTSLYLKTTALFDICIISEILIQSWVLKLVHSNEMLKHLIYFLRFLLFQNLFTQNQYHFGIISIHFFTCHIFMVLCWNRKSQKGHRYKMIYRNIWKYISINGSKNSKTTKVLLSYHHLINTPNHANFVGPMRHLIIPLQLALISSGLYKM